MQAVTINWDTIELLPKMCCAACGKNTVPWGRTLDNKYLCSKRCYEVQQGRSELNVQRKTPLYFAPALNGSLRNTAKRTPLWRRSNIALGSVPGRDAASVATQRE